MTLTCHVDRGSSGGDAAARALNYERNNVLANNQKSGVGRTCTVLTQDKKDRV